MQLSSWRSAQSCSKHVEDSNKHIIEEVVLQVGHLPELYEDVRPEKYKIYIPLFRINYRIVINYKNTIHYNFI
jgi:hypothetical protein